MFTAEPIVDETTSPDYNDVHHEDIGRVKAWFESGRRSLCYYRRFYPSLRMWRVAVGWAEPDHEGKLLIVASVELEVWHNVVTRGLIDGPSDYMLPRIVAMLG